MSTQITIDDDKVILVELSQGRGVADVSIGNIAELAEKSAIALKSAMTAMFGMARLTVSTLRSLSEDEQPTDVEMTFGLKLTSDAKALVVSAGGEAQLEIKMAWKRQITKELETNST